MASQRCWDLITSFLSNTTEQTPPANFEAAIATLEQQHSLSDIVLQYFFKTARTQFEPIARQFHTILQQQNTDHHVIVSAAIDLANTRWVHWQRRGLQLSSALSRAQHLAVVRDYTTEQLLASFNVALFNTEGETYTTTTNTYQNTTQQFAVVVEKYFRDVFNETHRSAGFGQEDDDEDGSEQGAMDLDDEGGTDNSSIRTFSKVCAQLRSLCWVNRLEPAFTSVLYEKLETHILEMCKGEFEDRLLSQLDDWMEQVALQWLRTVHAPAADHAGDGTSNDRNTTSYRAWTKRLRFHLYTTFGALRISEMFVIVKGKCGWCLSAAILQHVSLKGCPACR